MWQADLSFSEELRIGRSISGDGREMAARMRVPRAASGNTGRTREGRRRECAAHRKSCNARNNTPCNIKPAMLRMCSTQHAPCSTQPCKKRVATCRTHTSSTGRCSPFSTRAAKSMMSLPSNGRRRHDISYLHVCVRAAYAVVPQCARMCAPRAQVRMCARVGMCVCVQVCACACNIACARRAAARTG